MFAYLVAFLLLLACTTASEPAAVTCPTTVPLAVTSTHGLVTPDNPACKTPAGAAGGLRTDMPTAPKWAVAKGIHSVGSMRRIRRLAGKLLLGDNVTVSVAGGSISRGWADSERLPPGSKGCVASRGSDE
jgi:hypothetical protein